MHFLRIISINSRHIRKYFSEVSDQNLKYFLTYSLWCTERTRDKWACLGSWKAIFSKRYFSTLRAQVKEFLSTDINNSQLYFKLISVASIWTRNIIWKVTLNIFFLHIHFEFFLVKWKCFSSCCQIYQFSTFLYYF